MYFITWHVFSLIVHCILSWLFWWSIKASASENISVQTEQMRTFRALYDSACFSTHVFAWTLRFPFWVNRAPQILQAYGLMPVWSRSWVLTEWSHWNVFPQKRHCFDALLSLELPPFRPVVEVVSEQLLLLVVGLWFDIDAVDDEATLSSLLDPRRFFPSFFKRNCCNCSGFRSLRGLPFGRCLGGGGTRSWVSSAEQVEPGPQPTPLLAVVIVVTVPALHKAWELYSLSFDVLSVLSVRLRGYEE